MGDSLPVMKKAKDEIAQPQTEQQESLLDRLRRENADWLGGAMMRKAEIDRAQARAQVAAAGLQSMDTGPEGLNRKRKRP